MDPISIATIQPQPDSGTYGEGILELFQRYSRPTFLAAFGVQAPAWRKDARIKKWADTAAALLDPNGTYLIEWAQLLDGKVIQHEESITNAEAALWNLPGTVDFAPYVVAPSGVYIVNGTSQQFIDNGALSTQADGQALIKELKAAKLKNVTFVGPMVETAAGYPHQFTAGETRDTWDILINGLPYNVGKMIGTKNAQGIGAPGHWEMQDTGLQGVRVVWVSDVVPDTSTQDTRPEVPTPQRPLWPNEAPFQLLVGTVIKRTDLVDPNAPPTVVSNISLSDPDLLALAQDSNKRIIQLQAAVGKIPLAHN